MEHVVAVVAVEHADSHEVRRRYLALRVIVVRLARCLLLRSERNEVVKVEIVTVGGVPREAPSHTRRIGVELRRWGTRDGGESHVPVLEMNRNSVESVRPERAGFAARVPVRRE